MKLVVLTGIPGSGSTTILKKTLEEVDYLHLNYGDIMTEIAVEKGLVISQDQEAQKKVQKGTTIVLTISKGKKEVTQKTETQQTTQVPETQQAPQAPQTPQVPQTPQAPQTPSDTGTHGDVPADQGTTDDGWQTNYDMEW